MRTCAKSDRYSMLRYDFPVVQASRLYKSKYVFCPYSRDGCTTIREVIMQHALNCVTMTLKG